MAEVVLVTGGTGMLGSAIVRDLLNSGAEVVAADLNTQEYFLRGRGVDPHSIAMEELDVADQDGVKKLFDRHRISSVVHLAAGVSSLTNPNPVAGARVNCVGTAILLDECLRRDVPRVVMASTASVYRDPDADPEAHGSVSHKYDEGAQEYTPYAITYGAGKAFLEALGNQYSQLQGMEIAGMRCAFIASAGRPSRYPVGVASGEFVDAPALGLPTSVRHGRSVLPYVWVDDVSTQFLTLLTADADLLARGRFFNTGAVTCTVAEIAEIVRELIPGAEIEVGTADDDLVLGNPKTNSDALFVDTFGVSRKFGLREAVAAQIEAARHWPGLKETILAGAK